MLNINDLSLDEKIKLLCGRDHWHLDLLDGKIDEFTVADGPHGLRHQEIIEKDGKKERITINDTTAMPSAAILASSWDPEMAQAIGETIAEECIIHNRDVLLAPGVNIKRTPVCGRNFEYYSEDPYLAGVMARSFIEGVQSKGIGTSLKHFAVNNSENDRHHQTSEIDERTLREIYCPAFELALEAKPWTVMCSYNPLNGIYASENPYLLKILLRDKFGFEGVIVSDWCAVKESSRSLKAGLDLEMPYRPEASREIYAALRAGFISEDDINVAVGRILQMIEISKASKSRQTISSTPEERHEIAVKCASEGAVLLKNEDNILPLKSGRILITGLGKRGIPTNGGGSSLITPSYEMPTLGDCISAILGDKVEVIQDFSLYTIKKQVGLTGTVSRAYSSDVVIFTIGNDSLIESEGYNRDNIDLPPILENALIELTRVNKNVVVVLNTGSAVNVSRFVDRVKAILYIGFSGEGCIEAAARLLTGVVSPSGKLAETFPISLEDTPTHGIRTTCFTDRYEEGVFVGYRYYDTFEKDVAFPFGHGLSYSSFEYSGLSLERANDTVTVNFDVKNTGKVTAKEVCQVYVRDVFSSVMRPIKELKGFKKVLLDPGETKSVSIVLDRRAFCYYNTIIGDWYLEDGVFEVMVGSSSRDIRLTASIDIHTDKYSHYSSTICGEGAL